LQSAGKVGKAERNKELYLAFFQSGLSRQRCYQRSPLLRISFVIWIVIFIIGARVGQQARNNPLFLAQRVSACERVDRERLVSGGFEFNAHGRFQADHRHQGVEAIERDV
jgi:hypothetical protein